MKKFALICTLALFGTSSVALANTAKCGAEYKIKRTVERRFDAATCSVPSLLEPVTNEALDDARNLTLKRLAGFDGSCTDLGGTVTVKKYDEKVVSELNHAYYCNDYEFASPNHFSHCQAEFWCDVTAKSEITHVCECN